MGPGLQHDVSGETVNDYAMHSSVFPGDHATSMTYHTLLVFSNPDYDGRGVARGSSSRELHLVVAIVENRHGVAMALVLMGASATLGWVYATDMTLPMMGRSA